ncbi:hypothetical protein GW17_00030397 [Ensete ventricosum]|nr:hypothetical protein GW17_00030397 [Ensete ventricosum]
MGFLSETALALVYYNVFTRVSASPINIAEALEPFLLRSTYRTRLSSSSPTQPSDPAAACARIFAFFCRGRAEDDLRLPYEEQEKDGAVANPDTFLLRWGYSRSSSDLIFSPSLGRSSSESLVSRRWGVRYALFSCLLILIFCSGSFLILASNLAFIGYDLDRVPSPSPSHASMWTSDSAADRTQNVAFFCCGVAEEGPSAAPMTGRRMEPSSQSFQSTWSVICA